METGTTYINKDDSQMPENAVNQPISQPRIDQYPGSNVEKSALLNVTPEDLPKDMTPELRQNIVKSANEVYHLGTKRKLEYANVLESETGKSVTGKLIEQNIDGTISLGEEIFSERADGSLSIMHNHANKSFFSNYDIITLIRQNCVKEVYLASNGRILRVAKGNNISYNIDVDNIDQQMKNLAVSNKNYNYVLAGCDESTFEEITALFLSYGLVLERW